MKNLKLLFCVIAIAIYLAASSSNIYCGNKELLGEWAQKKEQIVQKVLEKLKQEGKLPENGTIRFTAKVKPVNSDSIDVQFESLEIVPTAGKSSEKQVKGKKSSDKNKKEMDEVFRPRSPGPVYTEGEIKITGGKVEDKHVEIVKELTGGGKAEDFESKSVGKEQSESTSPNWWHKFLRFMKIQ